MYPIIIVTAFLVSLDAIFVGMSLRLQKGFKYFHFLSISAIILTFCVLAYLITTTFKAHITFQTDIIIGIAFTLLGIKTMLSRNEEQIPYFTLKTVILFGLVMSLDAVIATVSLTLNQSGILLIPLIIAAVHMMFLYIGGIITSAIKTPHTVHNFISALCLIIVGILNLTGIF